MTTLLITIGCLLVFMAMIISIYNKLVGYKNRMKEAWSGIDVYLKKRHDLIPNLMQTVKGYAAHERQTFDDVVRYRSEAMQAKKQEVRIESETGLGAALGRLMAVVENYPELKANANFLELQRQLSAIEEELSLSRRYYNGTVRENNIYAERFPSNMFANMFNFPKGVFFEIESAAKAVPTVSF